MRARRSSAARRDDWRAWARGARALKAVRPRIWFACLLVAASWRPAGAHEVRPGYLDIRATAPDRYQVLWKQPALGEMRLRIDPVFPADCALVGERIRQPVEGAYVDRMTLRCDGGLAGPDDQRSPVSRRRSPTCSCASSWPTAGRSDGDPEAEPTELRGVRPAVPGGAVELLRPRRRAHPARRRSPALRPGAAAPGRGRAGCSSRPITAFTVGHSVSLALATFGVVERARAAR